MIDDFELEYGEDSLENEENFQEVENIGGLLDYTIFNNPKESLIFQKYENQIKKDYHSLSINHILDYRKQMKDYIGTMDAPYTDSYYEREIAGCDILLKMLVNNTVVI